MLLLSDLDKYRNVQTKFNESRTHEVSGKSLQWKSRHSLRTDSQTDVLRLVVAFGFTNPPKWKQKGNNVRVRRIYRVPQKSLDGRGNMLNIEWRVGIASLCIIKRI